MRIYLTFLFSICGFLFLNGQAAYEIHYHYDLDIGREDYRALLLCYEDGSGVARIRFTDLDRGDDNILEVELQEVLEYDENNQVIGLVFETSNPRLVQGSAINNDDVFIFNSDASSGLFEPVSVISVDENGNIEIEGIIDEIKMLGEENIDQTLFEYYFLPTEDNYVNEVVNEPRVMTPQEKQIKMYLILVANTLDNKIGKACETDKKNMFALFKEVAEYLEIGFMPTIIEGDQLQRKNVENTLNQLKPGPNDIVIFYYSGHGYNAVNNYPTIDLRYKNSMDVGGLNALNIEDVYRAIQAKNSRLNIVIADCCNNLITDGTIAVAEAPGLRSTSLGWNKNNGYNLFIRQTKSILISASSKGELSAGNSTDGGFFTSNFLDNVEKGLGKFAMAYQTEWDYVANQSKVRTVQKAEESRCRMPDNSIGKCKQTPQFMIR